jgi:hypothetical protein
MRLVDGPLVTQIGWLVVPGLVGAGWAFWRAWRGDPGQLAWGVWAASGMAVCLVAGRVAPQYLDSFAPALAACAAFGVVGAWEGLGRSRWARVALPLVLMGQAAYVLAIVGRVATGEAELAIVRPLAMAGLVLAGASLTPWPPLRRRRRGGGRVETGLAGSVALQRTLALLAAGALLVVGPAAWTVGTLAPEAFAGVAPGSAWAGLDVERARGAYRLSLASESGLQPLASAGVAEAAFQPDAIRPELVARVSLIAPDDGSPARDAVAVLTVEQAARVVLATNRPVAILYDEYRSRPLLTVGEVDRLARAGEVKLFAVSASALAAVDPDLEGWIEANTDQVASPPGSGDLELRAHRSIG